MKFSHISLSFLTSIFIIVVITWSLFNIKPWKNAEQEQSLINWDIISYYSYLPAYFIYNDIELNFIKTDTIDYEQKSQFWPEIAPNGGKVIKTTMGMSILYSPFFIMGHICAKISNQYNANGFSKPYEFFLALSSVFYLMLGLYCLRKILLASFNETITSLTMICVVLGTNLYYYLTVEPCMSHAYNFSLISIFIYFILKWFKHPKLKYSVILGLVTGLIILIRPVNILILIFPLLYQVTNIKLTLYKISKNWHHIIVASVLVVLVFFPQLLYWKNITGNWLFNSYIGERFYFNNPHTLEFLFSYRKGWLVYTPIMLFALLGLITQYKNQKNYFWPLIVFISINIYVLSSWWCWWYGGSFGMRTMIDSYAFLSIPFAASIVWVLNQKKLFKYMFYALIISFIYLNHFQTKQMQNSLIHWDSMTKESYWMNFNTKYMHTQQEWNQFKSKLQKPDYEKAKQGLDEYNFNPF